MPNAVGLAARVLEEVAAEVGAVVLVPGRSGIFDVHLGDELIFTKSMLGRYPDPEDVMPQLRSHLGV